MHSFSDLLADGVVLVANKKSRRPSDHDHHYGHWRYENGASLVLGAILVLVGVGMLWSAAGHLAQPQTIPPVHSVALWMALTALVRPARRAGGRAGDYADGLSFRRHRAARFNGPRCR